MKVFFATIDPNYFDDGIKIVRAKDQTEASRLLLACDAEGEAVEIPGVFSEGEPGAIELP